MSILRATIDAIYRTESRRVFSTLIRLLDGDFELAEDAMLEAFSAALIQWPQDGIPANPRSWLVSAGRFKAIDAIRRSVRFNASLREIADRLDQQVSDFTNWEDDRIEDDRLRLVFTCCHPSLPTEAQIALTLREVCGLATEEIASAFLTSPTTLAQRIVRAKAKIRSTGIPFEVPTKDELPERLSSVLRVTYLVFNEGYYASSGTTVTRQNLSIEAIRLGRLIAELLPEPEVLGLLALMLLQESRRDARTTPSGDLILLYDQDRLLWSREMIAEGSALAQRAFSQGDPGNYTLQAAIAATHAEAHTAAETDWNRIVGYYDALANADPSPVIALNRAVAIAMRDGLAIGLELIDSLLESGYLRDYGLAHSAKADFCRKLGRNTEAREAYLRALELATQEPERRFLEKRLSELPT